MKLIAIVIVFCTGIYLLELVQDLRNRVFVLEHDTELLRDVHDIRMRIDALEAAQPYDFKNWK